MKGDQIDPTPIPTKKLILKSPALLGLIDLELELDLELQII